MRLLHAKTTFCCYNLLQYFAILLYNIAKLNIGKKITGLEIMKLNREKNQHVLKLIELMLNGNCTVYRDVLESRKQDISILLIVLQ